MPNSLKQQVVQLFQELQPQFNPQQKTVMVKVMNELLSQNDLLVELQHADQILQNCINAMTDNQRFKVGQQNCAQGLAHGWAFRTEQRKQLIARAQRIQGAASA
ncbi:hypothetical protein BS636_10280 [Acinetobacter sp. LoGeW2-3]|uniref:hypothetical protein n=1 Tax=Acinetobacter sp. LoGeW2-3 TaxID=1808001 RepID=UPI000C058E79|nr:hypothetical protein [Acinetobacter sp. LoGeW2-3]ATO20014.1 hypothetical protein BS636_10280 [Acinetobacter sp. LoGeW2-3]